MTDSELLHRFAAERDELAFAELVRRHIGLVYSSALRQLGGDSHRAEDVTQEVFVDLARKARSLCRHPSLIGWLYTSTHFAAAKAVRTEQRRAAREKEAHAMHHDSTPASENSDWDRVRPVLDTAMHDLDEVDRRTILLRFFDQQSFARIGELLGVTENAAQKRADRAVERLHAALARRGVKSTAAALGLALANQAGAAAPSGLATTVAGAALAGVAASSAATAAGFFGFLSASKMIIGAASVITAAAVSFTIVERNHARGLEVKLVAAESERHALRAEKSSLEQLAQRAEQRAVEAEKDNGELLRAVDEFQKQEAARTASSKAVGTTTVPRTDEELDRLTQQRIYQQNLAKQLAEKAKSLARMDEVLGPLSPEQRFTQRMQIAKEFAAQGDFQRSIRRFNEAMAEKPVETPVSDDVRQLQSELAAQNAKVDVTLRSDGNTWVSISGFMTPAKFETKVVTLLPGDYQVTGRRKGYRDVMLLLKVRAGESPPLVTVVCTVSGE